MRKNSLIRSVGIILAILGVAYFGYRAWWTPAVGGEPATGEIAPSFQLVDHKGSTQTLSEYVAKGPVIVAFYRGYW